VASCARNGGYFRVLSNWCLSMEIGGVMPKMISVMFWVSSIWLLLDAMSGILDWWAQIPVIIGVAACFLAGGIFWNKEE